MNPTLKKSLAGALALAFAGAVQASPLFITEWQVEVNTYFDADTINPSGVTSVGDPPTILNWGTSTGSGQSGLDIGNTPVTTNVFTSILPTLLPPVPNVTVTHRNQPITGTSLLSVDIISELTLTPINPISGAALGPVSQTFKVSFFETPNSPEGDICADGTTNNVGLNISGCADIFVIDQKALNFAFPYASLIDDGDGELSFSDTEFTTYFISFLEITSGLNPLPSGACDAVPGVSAPCLGFRTAEGENTKFEFGSIISTKPLSIPVPEPGTLALLGLGLGALGLGLRRRRSPTEA